MKVIFFGTPQFAVPTLEKLLAHPNMEVLGVVTQPDKRRGRGNELTPSPVKKLALAHNLPVWQPVRVKKHAKTLTQLKAANADVFVVVAYGQILSPEILEMPRLGCVNVHGSILPKYRGAAPIQWCLCAGETETGITTMQMDAGMDTGPMLLKAYTSIGLFDHAYQVGEKLAIQGAELLIETLLKLDRGEVSPIPQSEEEATYAPLIQKSDYLLDWSNSAKALHDRIRGLYPNCVATFRGKALKIMATVPLGDAYWSALPPESLPPEYSGIYQAIANHWSTLSTLTGSPGEVVAVIKNIGPIVQTGDGLLLLKEVQLTGKRAQSGWDFANGTRLKPGEAIENG